MPEKGRLTYKSLLISIMLTSTMTSFSQQYPFSVGFRYGLGLPMGQFASHEFKRDGKAYGAYALLGTTFSAEGSWQFYHHFGVCLSYDLGYYPLAEGFYLQDKDADDAAGSNFTMKSGPYVNHSLMLGGCYALPVFNNFDLSFKALGGICWSSTPDQLYAADYFMIGKYVWYKTPAHSTQPSVKVGAALKYQLFPHVDLLIDSEFSYVYSKFNFWDASLTTKTTWKIHMPLLSIRPGLNISF